MFESLLQFPSPDTPGEGQGGGFSVACDEGPPPLPSPGVPGEGENGARAIALEPRYRLVGCRWISNGFDESDDIKLEKVTQRRLLAPADGPEFRKRSKAPRLPQPTLNPGSCSG